MCPNFVASDSKSLTSYQKNPLNMSLAYGILLNFNWYTKKFHNCNHTTKHMFCNSNSCLGSFSQCKGFIWTVQSFATLTCRCRAHFTVLNLSFWQTYFILEWLKIWRVSPQLLYVICELLLNVLRIVLYQLN